MRRELQRLMAEATFEPFVFVMDSGDRYEVREWHMAVQEGDVIRVFRPRSTAHHILRMSAITSLEVLDADDLS
jgi:hypothetical protein